MAGTSFSDIDLLDEPSLDELFAEPIVQLIMKRDGVNATDMRGVLCRMIRSFGAPALQ